MAENFSAKKKHVNLWLNCNLLRFSAGVLYLFS